MEQHELVGRLVNDWTTGIVYRVSEVDEEAFPSELQVTMKPEFVAPLHPQQSMRDPARSPETIANYMNGFGRHSVAWVRLMPGISEEQLVDMKEKAS